MNQRRKASSINVYLDIDGVLLANDKFGAKHLDEFLEYLVTNHSVYWLTTHCMDGNPALAVYNVGRVCKPKTLELLNKIKPTAWRVAKTEAIDFSKPFLVFEDDLYPEGLIYDSVNGRFGTNEISPLYRVLPIQKDSEESLNSHLVAGAGLEPATSWL